MFLRGLDIRCAYANGLILEHIYGTKSEVVQDAMEDVRSDADHLGYSEYKTGMREPPPLFKGTSLEEVWRNGAKDAAWDYDDGVDSADTNPNSDSDQPTRYDIPVQFVYEGKIQVLAISPVMAKRIALSSFGMTLSGGLHSSDDQIQSWDFFVHPEKNVGQPIALL